MANTTVIKVVQGNVLRLNIPLQVKIRNTEQGEPTERTEDFYPSLDYPTIVKLTSDYKTVNLDAEVDGNVVKVEDKGTLKTGCYQIEVICKDDNGNPYRFAEPCVVHIVNYTKDADIEAGVEYEVETYTLEGAYFIQGEKGDKGDPGTTDYNELENKPDLSGFITISVNNLVNYYLKSETYTKQEVQALIAAIQQFHYEIYASTSDVTSPQGNVLYLIGPTGTGADKYEEYVYANSQFVKIGDTSIDLSGYYTSQQTDTAITQALNTALAGYTTTAALQLLLAGKQDVINDLATIRSGAAAGATAYQKPQGGIPSSDMSQGVQTSLGKADSSLQPTQQTLTNEQKQQARNNIGAAGVDDVPTLPNNVSYFSNDSGDGIVPTDGIRGEDIVASSAISVHPDVVTAITGEIGSATTITLVVPNDSLRHVWDMFFTTASDGGATIVVPQGVTLHVPSGYSIASGKTYEVRVIGVGNHYYLSYGEFAEYE